MQQIFAEHFLWARAVLGARIEVERKIEKCGPEGVKQASEDARFLL